MDAVRRRVGRDSQGDVMSIVGRARLWLRAVTMRNRLEREMHEEMEAHLAQAADRFMARGMSKRDAQLAARREFGHVSALQEHARDARGGQWVENLARDLKLSLIHISEPTRLLSISYAVFCLKKKKRQ